MEIVIYDQLIPTPRKLEIVKIIPCHITVFILQAVNIMTCKKLLATRVVIRLVRLCFRYRNYRIVNS